MSLGGRPCEQGKKREIVPAVPLTRKARLTNYARQAGRLTEAGTIAAAWRPTPAQSRRLTKKRRHATRAGDSA